MTAPEQSPISVSTGVMPALGPCWASAINRRDREPHQGDGMGQGWGWLLGRHKYGLMQRDSCNGMRGTTKQEPYACDLPLRQKGVGRKN